MRLAELVRAAEHRKLVPLVEVHTREEARHALDAGATFIGVNARDLDTLEMDMAGAARVLASLPEGVTRVHLSGIASPDDVAAVAATSVDAALIGETLMRRDDPEPHLRDLATAARPAVRGCDD